MTSKPIIGVLVGALVLGTAAHARAAVPNIESVTPNAGPPEGGTNITIKGTGLTGVFSVVIGGVAATNIVVVDDQTVTATTPAHAAGPANVTVQNGDGSHTLTNAFTYGNFPTALDDVYSTPFNTTLQIFPPGVLSNDNTNNGGAMTAELENNVSNGALTFNTDGSFTYTPNTGFTGTDNFTYFAVNPVGKSNQATVSINVNAPVGPQPPTNLRVTAQSGNMLTVRFNAPVGGPAATGFVLKGGINPNEVLASLATGSTYPIFTFTAPTGAFYIRMHTLSGADESGPSNEIRIFVNTPALPSAPTGLVGLVNDSALALAWNNTFGGGEPTGTVLDVTGATVISVPMGLADTFTFPSVPAGTYTFTVRETNASGSSAASNPVTLTFPGPCSGAPQTPANFLAYKVGSTIFVVWDAAPAGPAATLYNLVVTGSFIGTFPTTGRQLSGSVAPGSYGFTVSAANACGASAPTPVQIVVIP